MPLHLILYKQIMALTAPVVALNDSLFQRLTPSECLHRQGRFPSYSQNTQILWIDGYSLGELTAAYKVILALSRHSSCALSHCNTILFTSPTAHAVRTLATRLSALHSRLPNHDLHAKLLPIDSPCAIRRFFNSTPIVAGIFIEYASRPNLLAEAARRRIPLALIDARFSAFSHRVCSFARSIASTSYSSFRLVAAQTTADANRIVKFRKAPVLQRTSLKFLADERPSSCSPQDVDTFLNAVNGRPVWLAASTDEGDEFLVLAAHGRLRKTPGLENTLLILAPRMPARALTVVRMAAKLGFIGELTQRRMNSTLVPGQDAAVYVADTLGELPLFYSACDVAFIGNSFARRGEGHNFAEAAHFAVPVLHGPRFGAFAPLASTVLGVIKDESLVEEDDEGYMWKEACMEAANGDQIEELVAAALLQTDRTRSLGAAFQSAVRRLNEAAEMQLVEMTEQLINEAVTDQEGSGK